MKKLRLKKWVKITLVITFLITAFLIIKKLDDDFIDGCTSNGYSKDYCESQK